jgi:hypothetical protein
MNPEQEALLIQYRKDLKNERYKQDREQRKKLYESQNFWPLSKLTNLSPLQNLKFTVLQHYSKGLVPLCACCQEYHLPFLCLDHIHGNGASERRELKKLHIYGTYQFYQYLIDHNFPEGYQTLCNNCNIAKRSNNILYCPVHHPELYRSSYFLSECK